MSSMRLLQLSISDCSRVISALAVSLVIYSLLFMRLPPEVSDEDESSDISEKANTHSVKGVT